MVFFRILSVQSLEKSVVRKIWLFFCFLCLDIFSLICYKYIHVVWLVEGSILQFALAGLSPGVYEEFLGFGSSRGFLVHRGTLRLDSFTFFSAHNDCSAFWTAIGKISQTA